MKALILAALFSLVLATVARAQDIPVADVAVGYSVIEVPKGYSLTANGGSGSRGFYVNQWLGIFGDFGVYHASPGGAGLTAETYTFGPRFTRRHWNRIIPFAQALIGGAHASSAQPGFTGVTNAFAFGAGGGADFGLSNSQRFLIRPQLEYLGFRANGQTTGSLRFSMGIVFQLGKKRSVR